MAGTADPPEIADLLWILRQTRVLLEQTVDVVGPVYLPDDLMSEYTAAWPDVDHRFLEVESAVRELGASSEGLREHGLLEGPNMTLKRKGFTRGFRRFLTAPSRWTLRHALGWADVPLESLAAVVPPAGLIKEFKQAVERGLEEGDEVTP